MAKEKYILFNGEPVAYGDAKIHVMAPAITYAATVFEGIRGYWDNGRKTMWLFRLNEHLKRLQDSMKIMRYGTSFELAEMADQVRRIVQLNELSEDIHIRLLAMIEGVPNITTSGSVSYAISAGPYPPNKWVDKGLSIGVSSWQRVHDTASPPRVKATANYSNGRLAMVQAQADGYDAAMMLTRDGKVSEAPVAAFFMIRGGTAHTPMATDGILESITRDTLITLFKEQLHIPVLERQIDRTELYTADEMFLCGSGWEIAPIASVDRVPVQDGRIGPITQAVRALYRDVVTGRRPEYAKWLTAA